MALTQEEQQYYQKRIQALKKAILDNSDEETLHRLDMPVSLVNEALALLLSEQHRILEDKPLFAFVVRNGDVSEFEVVSEERHLPFRMIVIDPDHDPEIHDYYDIEQVPDIDAWTQDTVREN